MSCTWDTSCGEGPSNYPSLKNYDSDIYWGYGSTPYPYWDSAAGMWIGDWKMNAMSWMNTDGVTINIDTNDSNLPIGSEIRVWF